VPEGVYAAWVGSSQNHAQCCALQAYSIFMMPAPPPAPAASGGGGGGGVHPVVPRPASSLVTEP